MAGKNDMRGFLVFFEVVVGIFLFVAEEYRVAFLFIHVFFDFYMMYLGSSHLFSTSSISFKSLLILVVFAYNSHGKPLEIYILFLQLGLLIVFFTNFLNLFQDYSILLQQTLTDSRNLLRNSTNAMGICTKNGILVESNGLFNKLFKVSERNHEFNPETLGNLSESIKNALKSDQGHWDFGEIQLSNITYKCSGEIADFRGSPSLFLILTDMQSQCDLEKMTTESTMKSDLLRTVSHELRTPLNSIMTMISSISGFKQTSKNSESLKIASYSCSYLLFLINDLIDYSQIKAGCLRISKSWFLIRPFLQDCTDLIQYQASLKSIQILINISENIPEKVFTDPFRLKQILLNLLSNALKFTTQGSISLNLSLKDMKLKFTCEDTGIGIDSKNLTILFNLFGKIDESSSELNPQGAGLGLYISNILVKKLGGTKIEVTSKLKSGSEFSFFIDHRDLELQTSSFEEIPEEINNIHLPSPTKIQHKLDTNNKKIRNLCRRTFTILPEMTGVLVVDDCCFNTTVFTKILTEKGFYVHVAYNGEEALEEIWKNPDVYHCILLDCEMPVLNGWETTEKLRKLENEEKTRKNLVIIGTSSHGEADVKEKCVSSGMDDFISKPCTADDLASLISEWVQKKRLVN